MQVDVFTGVVLIDENEQIYLIKEDDANDIGQGRWNLPGGSIDDRESISEAAKREVLEETGYIAEVNSLVGFYHVKTSSKQWLYVVFGATLVNDSQTEISDTSIIDGKWFSKEDFQMIDNEQLVHSDMKLVYQVALDNKGLSLESVKQIEF